MAGFWKALFGTGADAPPGAAGKKKLSLINVRDFPREAYSAYWEYGVSVLPNGQWKWVARVLSYTQVHATPDHPDPFLLDAKAGEAESENEARRAAQTWVGAQMPLYRRKEGVA